MMFSTSTLYTSWCLGRLVSFAEPWKGDMFLDKDFCYFHPENWGRFPIWLLFCQMGWNHQQLVIEKKNNFYIGDGFYTYKNPNDPYVGRFASIKCFSSVFYRVVYLLESNFRTQIFCTKISTSGGCSSPWFQGSLTSGGRRKKPGVHPLVAGGPWERKGQFGASLGPLPVVNPGGYGGPDKWPKIDGYLGLEPI